MKRGRLITIGSFDGIHCGHQALVSRAIEEARKRSLKSLAVTFRVPPRMFLDKSNPLQILSDPHEKKRGLREAGIDEVKILDFDKKLSQIRPFTFFRDVLLKTFGAKGIVVGTDFRFGADRSAGAVELVRWGLEFEIPVWVIPPVRKNGTIVSSSLVRHLLLAGRFRKALNFLGHPYLVSGVVVRGRGWGRKIGFPTANLKVPVGKILPRGVFAVQGESEGSRKTWPGVLNIGVRPTIDKSKTLSVEVHFFQQVPRLNGKRLYLKLAHFLRPERRFPSVEKLSRGISADVKRAGRLLRAV